MGEEREERSFGSRETLRSEKAGAGPLGEVRSFGDRDTLRDEEGWGILEEWGGKRWKPGEEILGRYVVEKELGQGGMGVVYACLDKVGGVRVAVKALPPELSHNSVEMEEVRENFELVYKLSHPNIAGVRTLERDGRGEYFLVMEVAEGESLRRWMRRKLRSEEPGVRSEGGGAPLTEVLPVLRQVAAALDYAHAKKVVHRDVKPGNVMIDPAGEVKVLDFGLAAQIRTSLSRASRAYRGTSGTGPYMAPEQWKAQPQDGKADQYALGVMAYEMLAGRLPFENSELGVLKEAVLNDAVPTIPGLPGYAMRALRRAMAKRKEERFESCGAFVAALGGTGGRRNARGKTLVGWVAALVLAGAGAWWGVKQAAHPQGSPRQKTGVEETRQDAASPEELAEAAAKEAARLAAERAAEEEARRLEAERVRAEREEKIRQESEALEETVYRLAPLARTKAENAERMGYDRGQRFGEKLDEMKEKLQQGEAAMQGRNFGKAKAWFEESMAAAGWLEENAPLREAAGRAKEAAGRAKEAAEAMDGAHLGLTSWRKGEKAREKAETAWGKAEFRDATAGWNEARTAYAESEKAARAAKVEQGLEAARGAKKRGAWEAVVAAADGVLALDGGNAEAKKLKAEAEANLKPSILLTATLDGREVAATVTEGVARSGMKTPVAVNLERGGPYEFAAEYQAGGKTYAGRTTVQAKAKGVTEAAVALREVQAAEEGSRAGERMTVRVGSREVALRWCPAGSFMMGSPGGEEGRGNDEVQHRVTLTKGFWMGETEVTQGLWKEVMGGNPSCFKNGDGYPVENVSWTDCDQFVKTLNSRYGQPGMRWALPTEAQWEYACRAGSTTAYFWGNALNGDKANCNGNYPCGTTAKGPYKRKTTPVGSYAPNAWGMYDMHGNVWEWCAARYEPYPSSAVTDPTGAVSGSSRVYRGGSWYSDARSCRSAQRNGGDLGFRDYRLGLRVVLSPVQ